MTSTAGAAAAATPVLKKPTRWSRWEEEDDGELPELPWKKVMSCAAPPDVDDENHAQTAYMAPVSASPPVMMPKSYATVCRQGFGGRCCAPPSRGGSQAACRSFDATSVDLKPPATARKHAADMEPDNLFVVQSTPLPEAIIGFAGDTAGEVRASNNLVTVTIPKVFLNQSDESKEAATELAAKAAITEAQAEAESTAKATATTVATAEAKAEGKKQPVTTSAAVKPAGTKQKIKKQQAVATAGQATAAQAKEDAKRRIMSFAGARALVGAALLLAVALWSISSGAAKLVTTKSTSSWVDDQQCGMHDFTAVPEAFETTCPADSGFDPSRRLSSRLLLSNISVLHYFLVEGDVYMPLTGRANHDLSMYSVCSTFANDLDPCLCVLRPVAAHPNGGDCRLAWEAKDLAKYAKELTPKHGALRAEEIADFGAFFRRMVCHEPPDVLYFAQFAAAHAALRSAPQDTCQWILQLVEASHPKATFHLEMVWLNVLHSPPGADWAGAVVDREEEAPIFDHLAGAGRVLGLKVNALAANHMEEQPPLAGSPEPETSPPPLQWLPVLLTFNSPHGEHPTSPIDAAVIRASPSPASHGPVSAIGTEAEGMRALSESGCTDTDGGATDNGGYGCLDYSAELSHPRYCGDYDDTDFTSSTMCCGCGGGDGCTDRDGGATDTWGAGCSVYNNYPNSCGGFDDADFTSRTMCCACGGGNIPSSPPSPPLPPLQPPLPPSPPLQPGSRYAISAGDLIAALGDSAVSRIVLLAGTYEFDKDMCSHEGKDMYIYFDPVGAEVFDHTHGGSALCIERNVTIEAEVAGSVVLDAKGARRVIYVAANGTAELVGLNITKGVANNGAGILIDGSADLTDCNIHNNWVDGSNPYGYGGGLYIEGNATLTNTNVYENRAVYGGGLSIFGTATLTGTNVYENWALQGDSVYVRGTLTMTTSKLERDLYLAAGSTTTYVLPAPPGYWVPATKCEVWREACLSDDNDCLKAEEGCKENPDDNVNICNGKSGSCQPTTFSQPCDWAKTPALLGKTVYVLPLGWHNENYPFECAAGVRGGNGSLTTQQTSAACAGRCPIGFTTKGRGAQSLSGCGCPVGYYKVESDGGNPWNMSACKKCDPISMVCDESVITVFELPVAPGFWRQHNWSAPGQKGPGSSNDGSVLPCHTKEACLGGVDPYADSFCAPSQQGPYCAVCRDGYFGGGDGALCEPCEGYAALTFLPMVFIGIGLLFLLVYILLRSCYCGKDILEPLVTASSELTDAVAKELEQNADPSSTFGLFNTVIDTAAEIAQEKATEEAETRGTAWATRQMAERMEAKGGQTNDSFHKVAYRMKEAAREREENTTDVERFKAACGHGYPKTMKRARWLKAKAEAFGPKLKILVALYQMLQGIGITFYIQWPEVYGEALRFLGSIVQIDLPQAMPMDCLINFGFFGSLIVRTAAPLLLILLLAGLPKLFRSHCKDEYAQVLSSGWFYVLFLVYPSCCTAVFQAAMCDELDDGSAYLRVDYSVQCYAEGKGAFSEEYKRVMAYAILMAFVYPLGTPVLYMAVLYANRAAIDKVDRLERGLMKVIKSPSKTEKFHAAVHRSIRQKHLGTGGLAKLTGGYEMRVYWFEVFECARKICLIGMPIFFEPGSAGQLIVGLLVCFVSFGMYASYEPYVKDSDDWLAKVAQVSLFFSLVSSIALKMESDSSTEALGVLLVFTLMVPPVAAFLFESDLDFKAGCHVSYFKEKAIKCFERTLGRCFVKYLRENRETKSVAGNVEGGAPEVPRTSSAEVSNAESAARLERSASDSELGV